MTSRELERMLDKAADGIYKGCPYPERSYSHGVREALNTVLGGKLNGKLPNNVEKDISELELMRDKAVQHEKKGCPYFGMTYSEGVYETMMWVFGNSDDLPYED